MGRWTLICWILTIATSYFAIGGTLSKLVEGWDPAGMPRLPLVLTGLAVLASLIVTARWSFPGAASQAPARSARRRFLFGFLAAAGGVSASFVAAITRNLPWITVTGQNIFMVRPPYKADAQRSEWSGSKVAEYRRLGRTGFRVSDISLGSGSSTGGRQRPRVAREAIERGINYFDTAPDYSETGSERRLGQAMKGVRDQMFVATKFCTPSGHLAPGTPVRDYMEAVEASLRRLQTDRVELVHIHSCDSVERLMDENAHEAFDRLKEQGKVRFLGVSTHTPNLEAVANAAIDSDRFDVMMLAYHFGAWPGLAKIIDRAASRDVGVVAMKTLRGARLNDMRPYEQGGTFAQAAFRWVLADPKVDALVVSMTEAEQIDEYLGASGASAREPGDASLLERYEQLTADRYCRPGCDACVAQCPQGVSVPDVLRSRMYAVDYEDRALARDAYAQLGPGAAACASCSGTPCIAACPYDLDVASLTREAAQLLG